MPDETAIFRRRRGLEVHQARTLVREPPETNGLLMKTGTIVNATIIQAHGATTCLR